jgi:hypothetical protein
MIETAATVTDEILDLNDRLIGSFFTKAKNKYERAFAEQGKAINDKVRLYAKVGAALVSAREQGRDPYVAIVSWDAFSRSVTEAEQLARDEDFDPLSLVTEHYPQLRRFAPVLLETFEFRPAAVARELIDAVDVLRTMNREGQSARECASGLRSRKWGNYVFGAEGIDRRFYELCVMAELKNALRSEDVSVRGPRQFQDFEDYLMPRPEFEQNLARGGLRIAVPASPAAYLEERISLLQDALDQTDELARAGQLPDVELNGAGLKISPIENNVPKEADALKEALYGMLPHVKITDLLMEVDHWTGFTRHFVHLKTTDPAKDPILLLTAILADATNLGLGKMAEACPGTSIAKLSWLVAWHIRDETYSNKRVAKGGFRPLRLPRNGFGAP